MGCHMVELGSSIIFFTGPAQAIVCNKQTWHDEPPLCRHRICIILQLAAIFASVGMRACMFLWCAKTA